LRTEPIQVNLNVLCGADADAAGTWAARAASAISLRSNPTAAKKASVHGGPAPRVESAEVAATRGVRDSGRGVLLHKTLLCRTAGGGSEALVDRSTARVSSRGFRDRGWRQLLMAGPAWSSLRGRLGAGRLCHRASWGDGPDRSHSLSRFLRSDGTRRCLAALVISSANVADRKISWSRTRFSSFERLSQNCLGDPLL